MPESTRRVCGLVLTVRQARRDEQANENAGGDWARCGSRDPFRKAAGIIYGKKPKRFFRYRAEGCGGKSLIEKLPAAIFRAVLPPALPRSYARAGNPFYIPFAPPDDHRGRNC